MNLSDIEVIVVRRPNMFKVNNNMYNLLGVGELKNLFKIENYKSDGGTLKLYYPERFLNIAEHRVLLDRICSAGYDKVQIITNSVLIIQSAKTIKIYDADEDLSCDKFELSSDDICMSNDRGINIL